MKYISIIMLLLCGITQQSSSKKFEIPELGLSFEEPGWYGTRNEKFLAALQKYNWDVSKTLDNTAFGETKLIRYHKDSINSDKKVFIEVGTHGLHESLQDFDALLKFNQRTKYKIPGLKVSQSATAIDFKGKKAIVDAMSFNETDGKGKPYRLYTKSFDIFMGSYCYDFYIQSKDEDDIAIFDKLVESFTIADQQINK